MPQDFTFVILSLAAIIAAAKVAGHLAGRIGQPAVLGELVIGVVLGNLHLAGLHWFDHLPSSPALDVLAQLGVLVLLFQVGLESTVRDMMKVGGVATLVALLGVVTPFVLGWGVGAWLLPEHSRFAHVFLGATLTATSVGITARVLTDLGRSGSPEARVILGAAVIDDVLGLLILALVSGAITATAQGAPMATGAIAGLVVKAVLFLGGALGIGVYASPWLFRLASRLQGEGVLLTTALVVCLSLAAAAGAVGLAPIVGAYAAGLILEEVHWRDFAARGERRLDELLRPLATLLVPIFFVLMGMRVDLTAFADPSTLGLAALLTLAAIAGKQACALGVLGRNLDGLVVGLGMMPRGEVGLIFVSIGLTLTVGAEHIVDGRIFSAVVIMVILTTLATPPALKWSLGRQGRQGRRPRATPSSSAG